MFFVIDNSPLVKRIVPESPVASILSPFPAEASAARNDPEPLSAVVVTLIVAACPGRMRQKNTISNVAQKEDFPLISSKHLDPTLRKYGDDLLS